MALQNSYETSSTYGSYGARYGGGAFPMSNPAYGGYDTSLPSTAASTASAYDVAPYSATISSFSMTALAPLDEQQIYERLADQSYKSRSDVLDHLRTVLRRSAMALPYNNPQLIFDGLALALTDSTMDVRQQAIQVIRDTLPKLGDRLIPCMNIILPLLINNIGDRKATVRKGVTQALHCYLKQPKADASLCLNALITHGFNSSDSEVVREVVAIVPVLLTQEFAEMIDISRLMSELMRKLPPEGQPVKDRLEQLALAAIEKMRSVVGEACFADAQNRCPRALRRRYNVLQSDGTVMDDADSDSEPDPISSRIPGLGPAPVQGQAAVRTSKNNEPSSTLSSGPVITNSSSIVAPTYASVAASSTAASVAPSNSVTPESKYFGIIPGDIYAKLMDDNPRARLEGADELKAIITRLQSGIALHSSLSDLLRFLSDFLDDANFKVVTTTLEIFLLLIKTAVDIRPHVGAVADAVGRRMSDAKLLIRQGVSSVILQLMRLVSAMPVLELTSVYFRHKNSRMRQESVNIAIAALLSFPKEDFDFEFLSSAVVPLLLDSKFQVRQAAMECVSVIAHLLTPGDVTVLMRAIHKVEDANPVDGEGLSAAVKVRAARHQLPRLNSDGLVEYSVALPGSASQRAMRPMPPGSDTSLILAAAGGHSAARPSQSVNVFSQGNDDFTGPRTPLSGKNRLPWQSRSDQAVPFNKRASNNNNNNVNNNSNAFFDFDDVEELVPNSASNGNRPAFIDNKQNKLPGENNGGGYFKHYIESSNKRQLAFDNSRLNNNNNMPAQSSSSESLNTSDSPLAEVWTYDESDHYLGRRPPPPKHRNNQGLVRPSQLPIPNSQNNNSFLDKEQHGPLQQQIPPQPQHSKKGPAMGAAVAPRQLANSVAFELSARAALDQPSSNSNQLSPPENVKQRGSASQRRAQRIFDRLESEDSGISSNHTNNNNNANSNKSSANNNKGGLLSNDNASSSQHIEELSPKMPQRKVPALEKAFFIDFGEQEKQPIHPPPKMKPKPVKAAGSPPRLGDNELNMNDEPLQQEPPRRQQKFQQNNAGMTVMDIESFEQSPNNDGDFSNNNNNAFPLHTRPARPERKSLPGSTHVQRNNQNHNNGYSSANRNNFVIEAADSNNILDNNNNNNNDQISSLSSSISVSKNSNTFGFFPTQPAHAPNSGRNAPSANSNDGRALMEEDGATSFQKPRKQPPPIKQPAISLGALNNRSRGGFDGGGEMNESFNNNNGNDGGEVQFFSKSLPRPKRVPVNNDNNQLSNNFDQLNGFKDTNPAPEPTFPGNATYSYLANMEGSSGIGSNSPQRSDSLMRSGMGFPSREDLSRQSTHSLMAEERLRSGDERMIEKYEELKRRQKAFLRALSANFASDVVAAEHASLTSTMSTGSLSAYDHIRQGTAPPQYGGGDGSGSAPPKLALARRPPKLKPVAPPAGYQPPQARGTPRKNLGSPGGGGGGGSGVAFTTFTVNPQLRAADLAYDLLPEPHPNPTRALADAATALTNEDWEVKCEGLNILRSVIKHQPGALTENGNQLHTVNLSMIAEMRNLRSQVARLAIQGMREMFQTMKRAMDIDAENIVKVLLGRSGDTNQFLRADSEQAITAMAFNISPNKAMAALIQAGLGHRNVSIRRSTAQHLLEVVERMGPGKALSGVPEVTGQLLPALLQFLMDGSPETRFYSRKICHILLGHADFDKMVQKYCAPNIIANARDVIETVRVKGPGELTSIGSSQRLSEFGSVPSAMSGLSTPSIGSATLAGGALSTTGSAAGSQTRPRHVAPLRRLDEATLDTVRQIIAQMASNDWRERYDGVTGLVQMTESSPEVTAAQLTKLFDKFCPLLKDMNSKVNLFALQAFQSMLPMISNDVGPLIPLIMQHLTINLSSKSHEIQQAAAGAMHSMLAYVDPAALLQPFANQTQTANSRNKAFMIDRLSEIVDSVCDRKMKQVTLHILPLLWHLLGSVTQSGSLPGGAGNIRQSTARLANVLHQHMGDELLQHAGGASLPEKNYILLQELLRLTGNESQSAKMRNGPTIGEDLDQAVAAR